MLFFLMGAFQFSFSTSQPKSRWRPNTLRSPSHWKDDVVLFSLMKEKVLCKLTVLHLLGAISAPKSDLKRLLKTNWISQWVALVSSIQRTMVEWRGDLLPRILVILGKRLHTDYSDKHSWNLNVITCILLNNFLLLEF